jgi:hypothetical protein
MPGARARTHSLVREDGKHTSNSPQVRPFTGIPCAMVLTVYGALTPERLGFVVSVTCGMSCPQAWHLPLGRQADTLWPSASRIVRRKTRPTSIASPPRVRDDAYAPRAGTGCCNGPYISEKRNRNIFRQSRNFA